MSDGKQQVAFVVEQINARDTIVQQGGRCRNGSTQCVEQIELRHRVGIEGDRAGTVVERDMDDAVPQIRESQLTQVIDTEDVQRVARPGVIDRVIVGLARKRVVAVAAVDAVIASAAGQGVCAKCAQNGVVAGTGFNGITVGILFRTGGIRRTDIEAVAVIAAIDLLILKALYLPKMP